MLNEKLLDPNKIYTFNDIMSINFYDFIKSANMNNVEKYLDCLYNMRLQIDGLILYEHINNRENNVEVLKETFKVINQITGELVKYKIEHSSEKPDAKIIDFHKAAHELRLKKNGGKFGL